MKSVTLNSLHNQRVSFATKMKTKTVTLGAMKVPSNTMRKTIVAKPRMCDGLKPKSKKP